jgi:hypothetical protein
VKHVIGVLHVLINLDYLEKCLICLNEEMSSLPILPNEAFTFSYNDKRGVELSSIGYHQSKDSIMNITRYINNKNS